MCLREPRAGSHFPEAGMLRTEGSLEERLLPTPPTGVFSFRNQASAQLEAESVQAQATRGKCLAFHVLLLKRIHWSKSIS